MSNIKTPASNKNVTQNNPNVPKTEATLYGFIGNSFNAGHNRTIAYKRVMAGEVHKQYKMRVKIKLLTPLTPAYMPLYMTVNSYFVPDSRVWTNAEKFIAQRGGSTEIKIEAMPHILENMPVVQHPDLFITTHLCNTTAWRDSFISCYVPRIGYNDYWDDVQETRTPIALPKQNILPLRGRVAIYNDFERDKNYSNPITEYKGDTVDRYEFNSYLPTSQLNYDFHTMRAKRPNSYYTDYRTDYQGFESEIPTNLNETESLVLWASWESKIAEARQQAENTNLTDWQILAKMRGSKLLTEGKVQHIGQFTTRLNYASVTQNSYNMNENVQPEYQVLGQQGAYSYTEVEIPCYAGFVANEEGTIHIIANVWAPTVFDSAVDRTLLNINALDIYRPELVDDKFDVIYNAEMGTTVDQDYYKAIGYKRKFSEYFKLPNVVAGDLTNKWYQQSIFGRTRDIELELKADNTPVQVITQNTYQFFETDRYVEANNVGQANLEQTKKFWLDYTDLMLAKNQAITPKIQRDYTSGLYHQSIMIYGQNQIDIVGECILEAILPIDEKVATNYTQFGEH